MFSLYTAFDVQIEMKEFIKQSRKKKKLTVEQLAKQSGVPYGTIRKFEKSGDISFRQFLMLFEVVGSLSQLRKLIQDGKPEPTSIEEVLRDA